MLNNEQEIGHYRIIAPIGAGGMGEVFLAQDTKLDRKVAIKFLNEEFSRDADKLSRFIREAKAVSALNHPNILTVYEIGESEGKNYIVTEFIDGQTLREHFAGKESGSLNQILKVAVQVAEALAAAHHAGIVHRDIKPENIMIRGDGYAKVLDFGLAKLTEKKNPERVSLEGETKAFAHTIPGMVMGTVSYMSPEQARGNATDARTDIWSLGVCLYEMLADKLPFSGETINHAIVSIFEKEPEPLENVPFELQRIISKTLSKEVSTRYGSARDLLIDLKELRRDLDIQGELDRTIVPYRDTAESPIHENETRIHGQKTVEETKPETEAAHKQYVTTSSLEYAVIQAKSHKFATTIVGIVLLAAISAVAYFSFFAKSRTGQIDSIAVMPFINESRNPELEYLSDGMTETLIINLSQLPNLSVKARSSVFRYKDKEIDPKNIGAELDVQAILNGRVTQRGDQLVLNLELIDARTENLLWGKKYERKSSELLSLQSEVARDVSGKLKSKLSGADESKVAKSYTENTEAYQLYLKGRFYWNKRTVESLKQAVEFFKQAIEKDPNYALAYSGLAESYVIYPRYSIAPPRDSMPAAKAAALRALEIDEQLAEAHAALGKYLFFYEFDRAGGEREYRRAIELNSNYPTAHQWLAADILANLKRFDEAFPEIKRAEELDPLSPIISTEAGTILIFAGRFDEAIAQLKRALTLDPDFSIAHRTLGYAFDAKGQYPEAVAEYRKAIALNDAPYAKALLARSLVKSGQRGEALKVVEELKTDSATRYIPNYCLAIAYTALGEKEEALVLLEKDIAERSSFVSYLTGEPALADLRDDPRFKEMLKRLNLPE